MDFKSLNHLIRPIGGDLISLYERRARRAKTSIESCATKRNRSRITKITLKTLEQTIAQEGRTHT